MQLPFDRVVDGLTLKIYESSLGLRCSFVILMRKYLGPLTWLFASSQATVYWRKFCQQWMKLLRYFLTSKLLCLHHYHVNTFSPSIMSRSGRHPSVRLSLFSVTWGLWSVLSLCRVSANSWGLPLMRLLSFFPSQREIDSHFHSSQGLCYTLSTTLT